MKRKDKLRKSKFMRNKKSFMFLLILCLGVGFAFLSTQLNITGNTSVSGNKWSVYFNNVQVTEGSVDASVVPTTTGITTTSVEYTVNLDKPGDFYEFTVDAVNAGTIDAMIDSITTPSIDSRVLQYVNYSATYSDGTTIAQNDVLEAKDTITYKVRVEYKKDISASDLDEEGVNLSLSFGVNYVQSTVKKEPAIVKLMKDSVLSSSGLDYTKISSDTNGKGLYILSGTENDKYPIYYYRGQVNNNAKFAGFCWKIVRTTETGGTKLIYNGTPNASGGCTNTTGTSTHLEKNMYNDNYDSPAYNGYMYGTVYKANRDKKAESSYKYGTSFTYTDGLYTLTNTQYSVDSTHHYTCFNNTGTCDKLSYIYFKTNNSGAYYINLTDGKSIEDAFVEMNTNTNDSKVKKAVDTWFSGTFAAYFTNLNKDYNDYLEDTIWCNDRSFNTKGTDYIFERNGWYPNGGNVANDYRNNIFYGIYGRSASPRLTCPNKNDSFTVEETATGNGALTYPVGLLTTDKVRLAGGNDGTANTTYYLYTNQDWWTMTPYMFYNYDSSYYSSAWNNYVSSSGIINSYYVANGLVSYYGYRPSISLKLGVKIATGGDGTSAKPYEFLVK